MKNVCIVGYGAIGPIHAYALSQTDKARFYAVCDTDRHKNRIAEQKYGVISYTDFDQMLLNENIDSVHICTPHHLHFDMIKKAAKAGKEIVCEKPLTRTKAEYDALLKLTDGGKVCVVLQNRLNPCIVRLKEIADSGELGKIKGVKGILIWHRDMNYYNSETWRGKWATEGGGVLINQAVHTLDFLSYIAGDVKAVRACMTNFSLPEIEVEDTCTAYIGFHSGVRGVFFATNSYTENSAPYFEIAFEKGTVCYKDNALFADNRLIAEDVSGEIGKSYWGKGHEKLIKNLYEKGEYFSPYDIKNTMYAVFAMYESAKNGGKEVIL